MDNLFQLYQNFFENSSVCDPLLRKVILPLFKGKGADLKIMRNKMVYLLFMQFGFKEGVGCTEASFTILETMNHMLERGSKVFDCFLDVRKAFDTVWIE